MKKALSLFVLGLLVVSALPSVLANDVGLGVGIEIETEDFEPLVFMCDSRVVLDDATEPGRMSLDGQPLVERLANYAFEGEQIGWTVLVVDKNGIEKVVDVYATIGSTQGAGNDIEVDCDFVGAATTVDPDCNAYIDEEPLEGDISQIGAYYDCLFTVETADSMYDEHWITVEAEDLDGLLGTMDENEYWFFNPIIALSIDGDLTFEDVRPGTYSYSDTLLVGNDADVGSGVVMDMFISGTDFYDSASSAAACWNPFTGDTTNQLILGDGDSACDAGLGPGLAGSDPFCFYATNGGYSTEGDNRNDVEGYVGINHGTSFGNSPLYGDFYGLGNGDVAGYELIQSDVMLGPYFAGNMLTPGSEMAVTFRLALPEPCNGDFDSGSLFFWGEAI